MGGMFICSNRIITKQDDKALKALDYYHWPGNVRELENLIEYLYIVSEELNIELYHLPPQLHAHSVGLSEIKDSYLKEALNSLEKSLMLSALNGNSLRKAAAILGVDPATFVRKLKKHKMSSNSLKKE
jgi:transcriptional regulator of acetoin/glycerol metabolism